jgi:NAD(P)-dependent dehydrogenase (short-subunit alcohol dehydrogenase family)
MNTIAIIGAGPGLGLSIARIFGAHDFQVVLLARDQHKLDRLAEELGNSGITAKGFPADVTQPGTVTAALRKAEAGFGPIDVLEYSPAPTGSGATILSPVAAVDLTIDAVRPQLEYYLYGGITAVQAVLPGMRERGSGTILVSTGASSGPLIHPPFGNIAAASGALRNWVLNLHAALEPEGIYAAHVAIAAWIGKGGPKSEPDTIAAAYWDLYQQRTEPELFYLDETMRA